MGQYSYTGVACCVSLANLICNEVRKRLEVVETGVADSGRYIIHYKSDTDQTAGIDQLRKVSEWEHFQAFPYHKPAGYKENQ